MAQLGPGLPFLRLFLPTRLPAVAGHSPLLYGAGGQTRSFPYSDSLQSLRAKRSISHEHQKTFRLSPISDFLSPISPHHKRKANSGWSDSALFVCSDAKKLSTFLIPLAPRT